MLATINSCVKARLYRKKGAIFLGLKKRVQPFVFFLVRLFFLKGTFVNVPFFPPSFFFLGSPFFPEGLFFPFFLANFLILLLLRLLPALIFHQNNICPSAALFFLSSHFFFSKGNFSRPLFFALFLFFALLSIQPSQSPRGGRGQRVRLAQ